MNIQHEKQRVAINNYRARKAGLEASLTLDQWLETINKHAGLCHYCGVTPFEEMDHIIPISLGGGTTKDNCVPSCAKCNGKQYNPKYGAVKKSVVHKARPIKAMAIGKTADNVSFPAHRKWTKSI